jgi:nitrogen fixation protein FixH
MVMGCLVAFFLVVAGVNAIMIRAALSTFPGTEVKNSYVASQTYNAEIAASRFQSERHWQVDAALRRAMSGAMLEVTVRDAVGRSVNGLDLDVKLAHPVDARLDHPGVMREPEPGRYLVEFGEVRPGVWNLSIEAKKDGARLYLSRSRITMPE